MRKFFKFLVGTASLAALAGGVYYFVKKYFTEDCFDDFDDDDFDDFDDFDDDEFDDDDDNEVEVNMNEEVVPEKETDDSTEDETLPT